VDAFGAMSRPGRGTAATTADAFGTAVLSRPAVQEAEAEAGPPPPSGAGWAKAPWYRRWAAGVVDTIVVVIIVIGLSALRFLGPERGPLADGLTLAWFLAVLVVLLGYGAATAALGSGQTPGMRLLGIRLIRPRGEPVTFIYFLAREVVCIMHVHPLALVWAFVRLVPPFSFLDRWVGESVVVGRRATAASFAPWA